MSLLGRLAAKLRCGADEGGERRRKMIVDQDDTAFIAVAVKEAAEAVMWVDVDVDVVARKKKRWAFI